MILIEVMATEQQDQVKDLRAEREHRLSSFKEGAPGGRRKDCAKPEPMET